MHRHMKTERLSLSVLFIFLLISTVSLTSCGGGGGGGGKDSSNPSITQMSQVIDAGVDHYNDLLSKGSSIENALTDTINWYKNQDGVTDAYIAADESNIFIEDVTGITTLLITAPAKTKSSASALDMRSKHSFLPAMSTLGSKALILDPYNADFDNGTKVKEYLQTFQNLSIDYLSGQQVTPETFEKLHDYDIIYHFGHGASNSKTGTVSVCTGEPFSENRFKEYETILNNMGYGPTGKYIFRCSSLFSSPTFGISSYFVSEFSKGLKATAVYIDGCQSLKYDSMAKAFVNNGAKSYLGWDNSVIAWDMGLVDIANVTKKFFEGILSCRNVQTAFNDLPFDWNLFANLRWYGDGNAKLPGCAGDTIPPTVPTGLTANAVSSSQINLTWNASTDNVGVVGYKIYRGENLLNSVTGLSTSDTGLNPNTQYCYKVSSYDAANNESLQSIQACATTLPSGYASAIYVSSGQGTGSGPSYLFSIVPTADGSDTSIGLISTSNGFQPVITDLALTPSGTLYGVSFDELYVIDKATAWATKVGNLGFSDVNALASDSQGNLYGATLSGYLLRINTSNGAATPVGQFGSGFTSSGDLAFSPGGILYAAVYAPNIQNNLIVTVAPNSGTATRINNSIDTGLTHLYGLSFVNGQLYGVTADSPNGALWLIDVNSGQASFVRNLSFSAFGAASIKNKR